MTKNPLLSTTLSLVALQLGSRLFSFGLNQLLLRSTTPQAFGVATIQLDVLRDTVLFLLREGIRGAVVRTRSTTTPSRVEIQSRLIPVLLSPLVLPIFYLFSRFSTPTSTSLLSKPTSFFSSSYSQTLFLYSLSTILELFSEPSYLTTLASWETLTSTRVRIEGFSVVTKAFGTLVALKRLDRERALEAYGWGQLVYSLTLLLGLECSLRKKKKEGKWKLIRQGGGRGGQEDARYFDREIERVGWALTKQSIVKQVLTEGDKLAVTKFGRVEDLGPYAVALNYGSLIARIIFQPLEESSRLYFSSLSSLLSSPSLSRTSRLSHLSLLTSHLSLLLSFYSHLSLILILLVPYYINPLLTLLLGPVWSQTSSPTLTTYVYSLPFLAINGILEAGVSSFADQRWIKRSSLWFGVCTVLFAATIYGTIGQDDGNRNREGNGEEERWGSKGLVLGNIVNMGARIGFSCFFLLDFLQTQIEIAKKGEEEEEGTGKEKEKEKDELEKEKEIWTTLNPKRWGPSLMTISAFFVGGRVCRESERRWRERNLLLGGQGGGRTEGLKSFGQHLGVGVVVGLACLGVIAVSKRKELRHFVVRMKEKRKGSGSGDEKRELKKEL